MPVNGRSKIQDITAQQACLEKGKDIYDKLVVSGFEMDVTVKSSLVALHAKCGSIEDACNFFDEMSERDVVSWT